MENTINKTKFTDKLYGGIKMSWLRLIIFALGTAVLTTIFLLVPVFKNTSFYEMGVTFEAWIFFAVIIMTNCEKPLESALKTFVFFLISQPLIYLFQVPFYKYGFAIFSYYTYWFIFTLLTFPMAFAGWYLKKRNWLSLLILTPILILLSFSGCLYSDMAVKNFPNHIIASLFCFGQVILYLYAFFDDIKKQLIGFAAVIVAVIFMLFSNNIDVESYYELPDLVNLSASAVVSLEDQSFGEVEIQDVKDSPASIHIHLKKRGTTVMTVKDGAKIYRYNVEVKSVFEQSRLSITPKK